MSTMNIMQIPGVLCTTVQLSLLRFLTFSLFLKAHVTTGVFGNSSLSGHITYVYMQSNDQVKIWLEKLQSSPVMWIIHVVIQ